MGDGRILELRTLVEVVRQQSFVKAAAALGLSPSAVSQSIARLEAKLGRTLLDRTNRTIRPTPLGKQLTQAATPILEQLDDVYRLVDASGEYASGTVRLSVPHVALELVVQPQLAAFAQRHPKVLLEISVEDRLIAPSEGRFDAGIRRGDLIDPAMVARRLCPDDELVFVAAPAYIRRRGALRQPRDLRDHDCIRIRYRRSGVTPPWTLLSGADRVSLAVGGALIVDSPPLARAACLDGLGIARLARAYVAGQLRSGALARVLDGWAEPAVGFHLYYPDRPAPFSALAAVRDWLLAEAAETADPGP